LNAGAADYDIFSNTASSALWSLVRQPGRERFRKIMIEKLQKESELATTRVIPTRYQTEIGMCVVLRTQVSNQK